MMEGRKQINTALISVFHKDGLEELLAKLNRQAAGRIILMAGSGVTEHNIREIRDVTGLHEFHFSAREPQPSAMRYVNPDLYMGRPGANEASLDYTTARRVAATIAQLLN